MASGIGGRLGSYLEAEFVGIGKIVVVILFAKDHPSFYTADDDVVDETGSIKSCVAWHDMQDIGGTDELSRMIL